MALKTKPVSRFSSAKVFKDPLFIALMSLLAIGAILVAVVFTQKPHAAPYEGPVTVVGKKVSGYACNVYYKLPNGEEKSYWYGKPGAKKCETVKNGPAISDGIHLRKSTFTD